MRRCMLFKLWYQKEKRLQLKQVTILLSKAIVDHEQLTVHKNGEKMKKLIEWHPKCRTNSVGLGCIDINVNISRCDPFKKILRQYKVSEEPCIAHMVCLSPCNDNGGQWFGAVPGTRHNHNKPASSTHHVKQRGRKIASTLLKGQSAKGMWQRRTNNHANKGPNESAQVLTRVVTKVH